MTTARQAYALSVIWLMIIVPCNAQMSKPQKGSGQDEPAAIQPATEIMHEYGPGGKAAIPALLEGLKNKDANIRKNAAFALGEIGPEAESAISELSRVLKKDPDREVRKNAAFALGEIGSPSIGILIKCLGDRDSRVRRNVAAALVRIGYPAVSCLINLLHDNRPVIRKNAAGILGRIGPRAKDAVPTLEKFLNDSDKSFCWTVKQALKKIKHVTVEGLIDCLNDKNTITRSKAAIALGKMGDKAASAIPELIVCLNDQSATVRKNAAFALTKIGEPALPALMEALKSDHYKIRKNAAFSLGEMGNIAEKALPDLAKLLNDKSSSVRWCADAALKKIKGKPAPAIRETP